MVTSDAVPGPSRADTNVHTAATNGDADAAGPSRRRSRSRAEAGDATPGSNTPRRPHSPDTTLSRHASPAREATPHLDLATYPTPTLLRLLASLLQQIASANDQLRAEHDDDPPSGGGGGGSGGGGDHMEVVSDTAPHAEDASATGSTQSRSSMAHPSPTTALFHDDPPLFPDLAAGDRLFTASKVSLSHPSSILSFHARHVPSISIEAYLLRILKYCPTTNEVFLGLLVYFDRMSKLGTPAGVGGTSAAVGPRGFAIDSYNVHRLIIAGVTVASKFFSDVFYTNSRYAKVGGLPPHELNQLELQFLLLNNFTLMIPPEEMQKYGDRLLAYWQGREHESGIEPETKSRRERERGAAAAPPAADADLKQKSTPMQVDPAAPTPASGSSGPAATGSDEQPPAASATAPPTPSPAPPVHLARSASLPRRPPAGQAGTPMAEHTDRTPAATTPVAPRGRERDTGGSGNGNGLTSSVASAATSLATGFGGWSRGDDGAVGVRQ